MTKTSFYAVCLALLALTACEDPYPSTPRPDNTIRVISTPKGSAALPPKCLSWTAATVDPYDNQLLPQYGCATARNLALEIERPEDLVHGRELGPERGVTAVGAVRRYDNNQTRGLIDPENGTDSTAAATTAANQSSKMTGDVTGGTASSAAASPSSSGP